MRQWITVAAALWLGCGVSNAVAQTTAADVAARYANENAVMLQDREHLTIEQHDDELTAGSDITRDVLLLTDVAPRMYNQDYVFHGFFHKLDDMSAATLVPDGKGYKTIKATAMKTTRSESESVFYDDEQQTVVTYPSLEKGATTHLAYTLQHHDIHFLPSFFFQSYMPVAEASFSVTAPKGVDVRYIISGEHKDWITMEKTESRKQVTYTWTARNVPAAERFDDAPEAAYYLPHVQVYVASYTGHDDQKINVLGGLNDLHHFFYSFIKDVNTTPDPELAKLSAQITSGAATDREKAKRIYQWVQNNIRYVAFEDGMGGFVPRQAAQICTRKFGDCKDMTSIQVALCQLAGLDAHFVWIGTRHKPYTYEDVPLPVVSNHMICATKLDGQWVFMDGTDSHIPFGVPPYGIQGKEAFINIDKDHYQIVKVPEMAATANTMDDVTTLKLDATGVSGTIKQSFTGYPAWSIGSSLRYVDSTELQNELQGMLQRGSNKFSASNAHYTLQADTTMQLGVTGDFRLPDYARKVDNEWYVNMNLERYHEDAWIDTAKRKVSVVYNYKNTHHQQVILEVPAGYHVSYLPADATDGVNGLWSYHITYRQKSSQVVLDKTFNQDELYVQPAQFAASNTIAESLRRQYKESIVLTANK